MDGYLWFEHYVKGVRGRVLNAHLYAAFGLRDYWQETRSPDARLLAEAAFTTVRELGERLVERTEPPAAATKDAAKPADAAKPDAAKK